MHAVIYVPCLQHKKDMLLCRQLLIRENRKLSHHKSCLKLTIQVHQKLLSLCF